MANKQKALMWVMFVVILVLILVLAYVFLVQPAITGYAVDRQIEGYNVCFSDIIQQVEQNQFVQLPLGDGRTLILVPQQIVEPQQPQQPQQEAPVQET